MVEIGFNGKEEFEDTKGVIRIRISTNRQHNGQKATVSITKPGKMCLAYRYRHSVTELLRH